jgi:hypothetical protein
MSTGICTSVGRVRRPLWTTLLSCWRIWRILHNIVLKGEPACRRPCSGFKGEASRREATQRFSCCNTRTNQSINQSMMESKEAGIDFPHWVSTPFLLQTDRSARVLPRMGQATPASRCEPTFRSSETPALLVPKQRHAQCRAGSGQGPGHTLQNVHTTNHQSPIT